VQQTLSSVLSVPAIAPPDMPFLTRGLAEPATEGPYHDFALAAGSIRVDRSGCGAGVEAVMAVVGACAAYGGAVHPPGAADSRARICGEASA